MASQLLVKIIKIIFWIKNGHNKTLQVSHFKGLMATRMAFPE
jgi:hypothetical protein